MLAEQSRLLRQLIQTLMQSFSASAPTEIISRFFLESESGEPQASMLLDADAPTFELLKAQDLLEPYRSPEAIDAIPYDAVFTYFGTKVLATVIAYNTALAEPVTSWTELANVKSGQLSHAQPLVFGRNCL